MVIKQSYRVGLEETGRYKLATNRALLVFMEDIAGYHSDQCGSGLLNINDSNKAWVVLNWKMMVIERPKYGDIVDVFTWSSDYDKISAYRDFEIKNKDGKTLVLGTSRWIFMDLEKRRPVKITEEFMKNFETESGKRAFDDKITKIKVPEGDFIENNYRILRKDMDYLGHLHNISYLDIAYETLPEHMYKGQEFNNISIEYRKEISGVEYVSTHLYNIKNGCIISINTDTTNAVISMEY